VIEPDDRFFFYSPLVQADVEGITDGEESEPDQDDERWRKEAPGDPFFFAAGIHRREMWLEV
jgi:hypothetical protein